MTKESPTIYSVASAAGVSTATVSRALRDRDKVSPATYAAVIDAVERLGYIPRGSAASLARQNTRTLGLVLPHITGWYYAELVIGFEMAASDLGYAAIVTLANPRADAGHTVRDLAERVDGIAFLARSAVTDDMIRSIGRARPVLTGARAQIPGIEVVRTESLAPAVELAGRLLDAGRRRVVFVGTPEPGSDVADRYAGYLQAHTERGLIPAAPVVAELEEDEGTRVVNELLGSGAMPDALMCANDQVALAAIKAVQAAGLTVPHDVAVTGWDNLQAARFITPALTTVEQPIEQLGATAARLLKRLIDGAPASDEPVVHASTVIVRESCGTRA